MKIFAETERLILREILPEDRQGIFELDADPEVHRYLGNKPIAAIEEADAVIAFIRKQYEDFGIGRWAVIEKSGNRFIGWSGLKFRPDEVFNRKNFYDLGYRFIKKYWGKGYATETARASVKYGFEIMNLPMITGMAEMENIASCKVLEKTGLSHRGSFEFENEPHNWYEITHDEWMKISRAR